MNEDVRTRGLIISGGIYLFLCIPLASIGIGALLSYPDQIWYLGVLFMTSTALLLYSGIRNIRQSIKKQKENTLSQSEMVSAAQPQVTSEKYSETHKKTNTENSSGSGSKILALWTFENESWTRFQHTEKSIRFKESLILIFFITAGGAWILHDDRGEDWTFSLIFCFVFAVAFVVLKHFVSKGNLSVKGNKDVQVIIDEEKVLIAGKLFYFHSEERWLENLKITDRKNQYMLEFTYTWTTRQGKTDDTLLIPIPEAKYNDAVILVNHLRTKYNILDPAEWDPRYKWKKDLGKS